MTSRLAKTSAAGQTILALRDDTTDVVAMHALSVEDAGFLVCVAAEVIDNHARRMAAVKNDAANDPQTELVESALAKAERRTRDLAAPVKLDRRRRRKPKNDDEADK